MSIVTLADAIGFAAALLTLVAFAQRSMRPMRLAALAANLAFILYGGLGGHWPVLALHLVLLPLNVVRFTGECLRRARRVSDDEAAAPGIMGWV